MRRIAVLLVCLAARAAAHDFWIEPSTFRPVVGQTFTARLMVGQDFAGDPIPRSAQLIDSFIVRDAAGKRPVNGFENQDPAGYLRLERTGAAMIGYRSKPYPLELSAEKFNEFLRQEGLDQIPQSNNPHRERFTRYAKAMVGDGTFSKPLGFRFEIVPEKLAPLQIRILFEGKPLAGALVTAIHRHGSRLAARSDRNGRVAFSLPKGGVWLIKSVHIVSGTAVDWESLWASLTFELPPAGREAP